MMKLSGSEGKSMARAAAESAAMALSVCSGLILTVTDRLKLLEAAGSSTLGMDQGPQEKSVGTAARVVGPTDPQDVEAFLDRFFLNEGVGVEFSCAAVVLVRDGKILLEKGYGYSDCDKKTRFSPGPAPFYAASSSHVFLTTASQMGRFLIDLLDAGRLGCGHVWQTAQRGLYRQRFAQHPEVPDAIYGFLETVTHNRRALFHTGGQSHRSLIYLLPDQKVGFYLILGGADERTSFRVRGRLVQKFLDRYYPEG